MSYPINTNEGWTATSTSATTDDWRGGRLVVWVVVDKSGLTLTCGSEFRLPQFRHPDAEERRREVKCVCGLRYYLYAGDKMFCPECGAPNEL